ncbi:MAG TPA: deoxyribonuclease IV [Lentisphaeria bacterium]|nr:deoxyribonuclease IV [Lentisphaeria bacterium]
MPKFGAHMSISGGFPLAIDRGEAVGCDTIQIFTKSNRQWAAAPIADEDAAAFIARRAESSIDPVFVHASYLINVCSEVDATREKSVMGLIDEIDRAAKLELPFIVLHPGSPKGLQTDVGLQVAADNLRLVINATANCGVRIAIETMAGQGSSICGEFEHIARLYEAVDADERLGVCFDTCHVFAAGYDIRDETGYENTISAFGDTVGFGRLLALHLNDSKAKFGSCKDRHEHIGAGEIGRDAFEFIVNDERLEHLPMVIETPKGKSMEEDEENLATLRGMVR